ncbi:MAG: hypothetical protein V1872_14550 [bacterium]
MDIKELKSKIDNLDPNIHKGLRNVLIDEYNRRTGIKKDIPKIDTPPDSGCFAEIFNKAVDAINKRYIDGTFDYINKFKPDLYQEIKEADDNMNARWKEGLQGKSSIDDFREALKKWYFLNLKAIQLYVLEINKNKGKNQ